MTTNSHGNNNVNRLNTYITLYVLVTISDYLQVLTQFYHVGNIVITILQKSVKMHCKL